MTDLIYAIINSSPNIYIKIKYEKRRVLSDEQYRFNYELTKGNGWYSNNLQLKMYLNGSKVFSANNSGSFPLSGTTTWYTVSDKTDGTTPFYITVKDTQNSSWINYTSDTYQLPIDPAGSVIGDIANFNIEDTISITTTKYNSNYFDKLVIKVGTTTIKTIDNLISPYSLTFNESELNTIYALIPNSNTTSVSFELSTYDDNTYETQIGSNSVKTPIGTITNANPLFSSFDYSIVDNLTTSLTGSSNKVIKGVSTLQINNVMASGRKSADLTICQINDTQYQWEEVFSQQITNWSNSIIDVYVIDGRNNSTKLETLLGINFIDYTKPKITSKNIERDGSIAVETKLTFSGTFDNKNFGSINNTLQATYKYKETSSSGDWIDGESVLNLTIDGNNYSYEGYIKGNTNLGFDTTKSYFIKIIVGDSCSNSYDEISEKLTLQSGKPALDVYKNNVAMGGIFDETDTDHNIQMYGNVSLNETDIFDIFIEKATVLFSSDTGNDEDNITLSDNSANYRVIKVYGLDNDGCRCFTEVLNPNGQKFSLVSFSDGNSNYFLNIKSANITITETSLVRTYDREINISSSKSIYSAQAVRNIKIIKIVGYK